MIVNNSIAYDATKRHLKQAMTNNFVISTGLQHELAEYKCLFWSTDHFLANCSYGQLKREGKEYTIVFQDCTRGQIIELCQQYKNAQLKLSFRTARKHWNLPAVVIVKIAAIKPQLKIEGTYYVAD